jgi:hypothetical protein
MAWWELNGGDAGNYTNVTINPQGKANLLVKNDDSNLYLAIIFSANTNSPWLGIVFSRAGYNTANADAVFGNDNFASNGYLDTRLGGIG